MQNEASIRPLSLKEMMERLSKGHPARQEYERLKLQVRNHSASIVEAHKAKCKDFHPDCAAQVAADIREGVSVQEILDR